MRDTETGLYYYRARYYDPNSGKFLGEDSGRFPGGVNFYRYAVNDPIKYVDPFGLCPPTLNQRLGLGARGVVNLGIGVGKIAVGLTVTAETGGLGAALGYYSIVSGLVGNIGGGLSQIAGAANGDVEGGEVGADATAAASSIAGLVTLAATKGNICKAAKAAQFEGIATTAVGAGLGESTSAADTADTVQNVYDLAAGSLCPPSPQSSPCSGQGCPK